MTRALLLVLAACGRFDFDPRTDAVPAGARLHLEYNVFDDGTRQVIGAYDTLLQRSCTATATATSAGFACLPDGAFVYYADAACTQPIVQVPSCGSDTRYAYDPFTFPVAHVYEIGGDIATPAMAYQHGADGACLMSSTPTGAYKALTEVPLDTFVPLTRELGAGSRVRALAYVAADGFRLPGDVFDTQANGRCIAAPYDDATVCEPYSLGIAYHYTDATCSHLVFNSNVAVDYALEILAEPICRTTDVTVRASLGAITPSQIWVEIPGSGTCAQSAPAPGWIVEDLGPPIPPAPLTRTPVPGGGARIQLIEDASGEAKSTEYYLFDSQLGTECEPQIAADGALRCMPRTTSAIQPSLFSDAGCTQPLALAGYGPAMCARALPPLFIADYTGTSCTTGARIDRPGPKYTGAVYSGSPTQCNVFSSQQDLYQVGTEIDPATFSLVVKEIDP
jgi:hypothetical protein